MTLWGDGAVEFKFFIELSDKGSGTGIWDTSVWDTGTWGGVAQDWTDITSWLMAAQFRYGRDRFIIGDVSTGTATFTLENDDGTWTPNAGAAAPGLTPLRPGVWAQLLGRYTDTAMGAIPDATTWTGITGRTWTAHGSLTLGESLTINEWIPLFTGRIADFRDQYSRSGGVVTQLQLLGALQDLANFNPTARSPDRAAEGTEERIHFLLDELNWPTAMREVDTGRFDVEADDLDSTYLNEARITAVAEGGDFYADGRGFMIFRQADWLLEDERSRLVQLYAGDDDDDVQISGAVSSWALTRIFNALYYANYGGGTSIVSDATSQSKYGERSLRRVVPTADSGDQEGIANRDLAILKSDQLRIERVTIEPVERTGSVFGLNVKIGDLVELTVRVRDDLSSDWEYTVQAVVAGIAMTVLPDDWRVILNVDTRAGAVIVEPVD